MSRGFCCGDGWFDLIDAFSARIEAESDRLREAEGWEEADLPMATQVKEKLGTLRFHVRPRTPEILEIFRAAFEASQHICELCGESKIMGRCPAGCAEFCD